MVQIPPLNFASDGFLVTTLPKYKCSHLVKCKSASKSSFHSPYHNSLASFCLYSTLLCLKFDGCCGNIQIYTGLKTQPIFSTLFSKKYFALFKANKTKSPSIMYAMYVISDTLLFLNSYTIYIHLHISFQLLLNQCNILTGVIKKALQLKAFLSKLFSIKGIFWYHSSSPCCVSFGLLLLYQLCQSHCSNDSDLSSTLNLQNL